MASAITHFIVGGALALPALKSASVTSVLPRWWIPASAGLLAVAPDFDTFAMQAFSIPYSSFFGHRGFFHSPFFLAIFAAGLTLIVARRAAWSTRAWIAAMWAGCAITHPFLDAMTDGGLGVMLLFPISDARIFLPWRPIHVSPISISRFFERAGYILGSELPFCLAALAIGGLGLWLMARRAAVYT